MLIFYRTVCLCCFMWLAHCVLGQQRVVYGVITDADDKSPLSFASVVVKNTDIRKMANVDGVFLLKVPKSKLEIVVKMLGYDEKTVEIDASKGADTLKLRVEMSAANRYLSEVVVRPGRKPIDIIMENVRKNREKNDKSRDASAVEQTAIFISKFEENKNPDDFLEKLKKGVQGSSKEQSPIYMEERTYAKDGAAAPVKTDVFSTSPIAKDALQKLLQDLETRVNVYESSFNILGKSIINPLAGSGGLYYKYAVLDTFENDFGRQYKVSYTPLNRRSTALEGYFTVDSASYAVSYFEAKMPREANINYIQNLAFYIYFQEKESGIQPQNYAIAWRMTYELFDDGILKNPEILISRNRAFRYEEDAADAETPAAAGFAGTGVDTRQLNDELKAVQRKPLYVFTEYAANIALTGYIPFGKFDIGNVVDLARWSRQEGIRAGLPFKTNQSLMKNVGLSGFAGYGFGNKSWQYRGKIQWILPLKMPIELSVSYGDEYKRIDYDENNIAWREGPLVTGDDNMTNTLLLFTQAKKLSRRQGWDVTARVDWNDDWESRISFRNTDYYANDVLPMRRSEQDVTSFNTRTLTMLNRVSFDEKTMDNNFQRLYIRNQKPVIFAVAEGGQSTINNTEHWFAKLSLLVQQKKSFPIGGGRYTLETGKSFGRVPYPLLNGFQGNETGNYSGKRFTLMNYNEFLADTYVSLQSEFYFNGILFNHIPLIKYLKLREFISAKTAYGRILGNHSAAISYPTGHRQIMTAPYVEVGAGITNLFGFLTIQSVWRLTNLHHPHVRPWGLAISTLITF